MHVSLQGAPIRHARTISWFGPFSLALLICAGQIKNSRVLSWLPFDLTGMALLLVILTAIDAALRFGSPKSHFALPIAIWTLFLPAVLLTPNESTADNKVLTLYTVTFALAIAPFFLLRLQEQRRAFVLFLAAISVFAVVNGLYLSPTRADSYTQLQVLEGADTIGSSRVAFCASLVLLLFALLRRFHPLLRLTFVTIALTSASFAISTGSRGPALSMIAALILTVGISPIFARNRVRAIGAISVTLAVIIPIAFSSTPEGIARIVSVLLGEGDTSTQAREALWTNAEKMIVEHPFGTGWGFFESKYGSYPHNLILELGAETGVLVTAIFLVFIAASLRRAVQAAGTPANTVLLALLAFSICNSMVSSDFNDNRLLIVCLFAPWSTINRSEPLLDRPLPISKLEGDSLPHSRPPTRAIRHASSILSNQNELRRPAINRKGPMKYIQLLRHVGENS